MVNPHLDFNIFNKAFSRGKGIIRLYIFKIINYKKIKLKFGAAIGKNCIFRFARFSSIEFGKRSFISNFVEINALRNAKIRIGSFTTIGSYSRIICHQEITIGNNCAIAPFVSILDHNHERNLKSKKLEGYSKGKIIIGNNVWIGEKAIILKGVKIGDNVTIGAGSVVTKNVLKNTKVAGVPAEEINKN